MTDFYALLKQSLLERGMRDARERQEVYTQARNAVIKQLWDFQPPLAADEIDSRVGVYDTAVERIEADIVVAFANGEAPMRAERAPSSLPAPAPDDEDDVPFPPTGWERDEPEEGERGYERGVERAGPVNGAHHQAGDDGYHEEEAYELPGQYHEHEGSDRGSGQVHHDRWSKDTVRGILPVAHRTWLAFEDNHKIQILAGAIVALVISLAGLGTYFYLARSGGGDGVTLAIGVRREVSDAATATRIASDKLDVTQSFALFDGRDPTIFATTPDNPVRFDSEGGFARASSSTSAPGVKVIIGPGLAARLAGHRVRVTIAARSSTQNGAAAMRFAYQSGVALSHWQTANLAPDYAAVGMIWRVPTMRTNPAGDYLLIEPGIPGDGTGVDIQSIKIDILTAESS